MEEGSKKTTDEKLLLAAIDLISARGYKSVTTLELAAAAGVSEKTLFRRFGSKQKLLEAAFDRFHYAAEMTAIFDERLVGDLHADLLLISRSYHAIMNRNRKMLMIGLKEAENLPGFLERTMQHPRQFIDSLARYFKRLRDEGKLIDTDPEMQAFVFISMNYGLFLNDLEGGRFPSFSLDRTIEESVKTFVRALTP
ncbi:TetR family transcriptional regulator [Saccharibacillus sp. O16]|nr:TetR family transcriptional regulator [Saccharibacillus sp. O16]